jgi:hypothetical protein
MPYFVKVLFYTLQVLGKPRDTVGGASAAGRSADLAGRLPLATVVFVMRRI